MQEQELQLTGLRGNSPCVTISLDLKFIGASKVGDEIKGFERS